MKKIVILVLSLVSLISAQAGDEFVCQVEGNVRLKYSIQLLGSIRQVGVEGKRLKGFVSSFDPEEEGGGLGDVAVPATIDVSVGAPGTRAAGIAFVQVVDSDGLDFSLSGEVNNDVPFPFSGTTNLLPQEDLDCGYFSSVIKTITGP